ncbi:MAG: SIMPL domain-containing protein [Azovibrio sp.]|uniref:SIMPL domain-containing protein n=1 Tax=Azovibrio sp. TaxID=1872673 RepID=UPI003C739147
MKTRLALPALLFLLLPSPASWAGTRVDIAADASYPASNDLARATVFAEASGPNPKALARQINGLMAEAGQIAKSHGKVKVQSGNTSTYPNYGRSGKIEAWRMRSELVLESRDMESLSELVGKLQESLGVASIQFMPAPETRKQAEDQAVKAAIAAFQDRAARVGQILGKPYKIEQMSINTSAHYRPPVMYRKAGPMMAEAAAPMPMEAGESQVQVSINGRIELAD